MVAVTGRARVITFEQVTSLSSATSLAVPTGCDEAWLQAEGAVVRYRADGTAPTTAIGNQMQITDRPLVLNKQMLDAASFIEESASAKLNVHYFSWK